jgi:hypothetical protein
MLDKNMANLLPPSLAIAIGESIHCGTSRIYDYFDFSLAARKPQGAALAKCSAPKILRCALFLDQ